MTSRIRKVLRNNGDHRSYKLIHPLDGRVLPASPNAVYQNALELSAKLNMADADIVVGFAEGGLIPAWALASVTGKKFVGSYRVRLHVTPEIHFTEPHSNRSDHYIYALIPGDRVVIVEDEITSGSTLLNAIFSLQASGVVVVDVGAYIVNCCDMVLQKFMEQGFAVKYLYTQEEIHE